MKKFFRFPIIGLASIILFVAIGLGVWWNAGSDVEKSDYFENGYGDKTPIEFIQDSSDYWMERSVVHNKAGNFEKGFEFLNKAVGLNPSSHLGYRGWIRLRKMRDYDKALIDFESLDSLTLNFADAPWGEDIDFLRGECYFGKKDYQKSIELFNRSIENQGEDWADVQSFVYLGLCEYKLGNYEKAITQFQRAINQYVNVPESYFGMAKAFQELGQIDKAKEKISKAEQHINSKRDDVYNEFLNEIYLSEVLDFKKGLHK